MELSLVPQGPVTAIVVQGDLDGITAEALAQTLAGEVAAGRVKLVLDASGVLYVSSAGLRALLVTQRRCRAKGGDLRLSDVPPVVLGLLAMAGVDRLFRMFDSLAQACDSYADWHRRAPTRPRVQRCPPGMSSVAMPALRGRRAHRGRGAPLTLTLPGVTGLASASICRPPPSKCPVGKAQGDSYDGARGSRAAPDGMSTASVQSSVPCRT